jgi:hypothetical protein
VRLARYHCRKPGEPAFIDRKLPGLYNSLGALLTVRHKECAETGRLPWTAYRLIDLQTSWEA